MIIVLVLVYIALLLTTYAVYTHITVWRKHRIAMNEYKVRKQKDDLIFLAVQGKLDVKSEVFERMFTMLESFEKVCGHASLKHLIMAIEDGKKNPLDVEYAVQFAKKIEASGKDVQEVVGNAFATVATIIFKNSRSAYILYFIFRAAIIANVVRSLPASILSPVRRSVRTQWDAVKALITYEDELNLRFS